MREELMSGGGGRSVCETKGEFVLSLCREDKNECRPFLVAMRYDIISALRSWLSAGKEQLFSEIQCGRHDSPTLNPSLHFSFSGLKAEF